MRYVLGVLLLAAPAAAGEPVYSWRSRADDPDRVYLYLDGKQVGGWCYRDGHYRTYDGKDWGAAAPAAPVPPPVRPRVIVTPPAPAPVVVAPRPLPTGLRGPLRVRFATAATDVIADTTMRLMSEVPRAVADSVRSGNARATFRFSVERTPPATPPPEPPPQR